MHQGGRDNHGKSAPPLEELSRESPLEDIFQINHPESRTEEQMGEDMWGSDPQKLQGERTVPWGERRGSPQRRGTQCRLRRGTAPGPSSRALRTRLLGKRLVSNSGLLGGNTEAGATMELPYHRTRNPTPTLTTVRSSATHGPETFTSHVSSLKETSQVWTLPKSGK